MPLAPPNFLRGMFASKAIARAKDLQPGQHDLRLASFPTNPPPMLIAYVSDERYVAVPDVLLELEGDAGSFEARSRATGCGACRGAVGQLQGHASEAGIRSQERLTWRSRRAVSPTSLRLLADGLLGYAWPKWVKAGEKSEFRVHSVEPYHLSLWRYGIRKELIREIGWFDEHGPARPCRSRPMETTHRPASSGTSTDMPTRYCTST